MRPGGGFLGFVLLLMTLWCSGEGGKKSQHKEHQRQLSKHRIHPDMEIQISSDYEQEDDSANHLAKPDEQDECHRGALHKCGQTFLKTHKLLRYLDEGLLAFRTRCGVRTAFFECLKSTREKICGRPSYKAPHHPAQVEEEFRKKLTATLWSTRVCVLGVTSFTSSRH